MHFLLIVKASKTNCYELMMFYKNVACKISNLALKAQKSSKQY